MELEIRNKDEEIKQLTDQMGILGDTLNQKQELIEEKNKKIESFTPRKGKKHTLT